MKQLLSLACLIFLIIPPGFSGRAKEKCLEYSKKFQDKLKVSSIIDPNELSKVSTEPNEFPHMVVVYNKDGNLICGGSLISENYVLTAAHCTSDRSELNFIRLGDHNIESSQDDNHVQQIEIAEIIKHPDYKPPSVYNDIALLRLASPVKLSDKIRPACLDENQGWPKDTQVSATGWGRLSFGGETSPTLKKVYLDYFNSDECNKIHGSIRRRRVKGIVESQICAGGRDKPKDTCQGDNGGPLQYLDEKINSYVIIGVSSFGKLCGQVGLPGVYTKVSHYVPWIESIVWK